MAIIVKWEGKGVEKGVRAVEKGVRAVEEGVRAVEKGVRAVGLGEYRPSDRGCGRRVSKLSTAPNIHWHGHRITLNSGWNTSNMFKQSIKKLPRFRKESTYQLYPSTTVTSQKIRS